jgi:hypothetical protein
MIKYTTIPFPKIVSNATITKPIFNQIGNVGAPGSKSAVVPFVVILLILFVVILLILFAMLLTVVVISGVTVLFILVMFVPIVVVIVALVVMVALVPFIFEISSTTPNFSSLN